MLVSKGINRLKYLYLTKIFSSILDPGNSSSLTKLKTSEQKKEALFDAAKKGILGSFVIGRRVDGESINDLCTFFRDHSG